ncbi:MAG: hypothetical protein O2901_15090 [Verrucomicrobia bacterium]|nr:hypothetical protein [Verrucomicrobiota bacterium]
MQKRAMRVVPSGLFTAMSAAVLTGFNCLAAPSEPAGHDLQPHDLTPFPDFSCLHHSK